jgi:hypothetical protein
MQSSQLRAHIAGATLSGGGSTVKDVKTTSAKVSLGEKFVVLVNEDIAKRIHGPVDVRVILSVGHPVVEIRPNAKAGRSFSPFRPGQWRYQNEPGQVSGVGSKFPKFGMVQPQSVVWGSDNVLRITLPTKRPPLLPRGRTVGARQKPEKEPEVHEKETAMTSPTPAAKEARELNGRNSAVAYSRSGVRLTLAPDLAKVMDGHLYGIASMTVIGEPGKREVTLVVRRGASNHRLGQPKLTDTRRVLSLQDHRKKVPEEVPFFGPTKMQRVTCVGEAEEITVVIREPFNEQNHHSKPMKRRREAAPAPTEHVAVRNDFGGSPLSRLRHARDLVNTAVREIKESGDAVTLRVKEDGTLGFSYEG